MTAYEPARAELHLSDARDGERDGDVHFLLAVLGDADAEDAPATARGHARSRWRRRWRLTRAVLDVAERAEQSIRLLAIDLPLSEQLEDLLPFLGRHQRAFRAASSAAAASSTPSSPFASFSRTLLISSRDFSSSLSMRSASAAASACASSSSER